MHLALIAHNIRSTYNVGSILRTADGFGVDRVYLTGYTPYPTVPNDERLPHLANKITNQIHKTALGAELSVKTKFNPDPTVVINQLKAEGYQIVALEQAESSVALNKFKPGLKTAVLLGEEVHGITSDLIDVCDKIIEIPMRGKKESFNVSVATGIALYALTTA